MPSHGEVVGQLMDAERKRWLGRRRFVGWLNAVFGLLGGSAMAVMLVVVPQTTAKSVLVLVVAVVGLVFVPQLVGGIAFAFARRWAPLLLWPISVFLLAAFPVGTLVGAYNIWVLQHARAEMGPSWRAIAITSAVPAIALVVYVLGALFPPSSRSAVDRRLLAAIEAQGGKDEFQRWLSALPTDAGKVAAEVGLVGQRGLTRLSADDQLTFVRLVADGLTRASIPDCAALARGSATPEQRRALITGLDSSGLRQWFEVTARAILAELRGTPVPMMASESDISDFVNVLYEPLSERDGRRLDFALDSAANASDEDSCWFARLFYSRALAPHPSRARWLRVITTLNASSG